MTSFESVSTWKQRSPPQSRRSRRDDFAWLSMDSRPPEKPVSGTNSRQPYVTFIARPCEPVLMTSSTLGETPSPVDTIGSPAKATIAHDPLTGKDHRAETITAPADALLIVDSVFAFRPEYNEFWDYRIWLDVDAGLSLTRGIERDLDAEGGTEEATRLHRDRYHAAEAIYLAEVNPRAIAHVVIDNSCFAEPAVISRESPS